MKIVIVEDNRIVLHVLKAAFDAVGTYQLSEFETAQEGIDACLSGADLAIFDQRLPDMKGIEAIRRLRAQARTEHLPIIMITADDDPETRMDAIQAGATDFLKKPLNISELRIRVRNLLALRQAQKNAAQRENLLRTVIAASGTSLAVIELAASGDRFVFASEGFLAATGFTHDEVIGAGIDLLWRVFPSTEARTRFATAISDRSAGRFVLSMVADDIVQAWTEVSLRPVPQPGAQTTFLVVTLKDISALVSAREANKHLFDRMSDIARISGAWFYEIDSDCRLSYISDTMAFALGLAPERAIGLHIDTLPLSFNDPQKKGIALSSLLSVPFAEFENEELTLQTASGATRCIQVSAVPFCNSEGGFAGFRGYASDVSAIAATRDAAARASRAKSAFLTTMSHEMQTPLTAIIGMVDILIDKAGSAETVHDLSLVSEAAHGLSDVLVNVLDLAALENDAVVLRESDFDLHALVDDLATSFGKQASEKGLKFEIVLDKGDGHTRRGDHKRVRQIFHALISNAVKFTETGGIRVLLSVSNPEEVQLIVSDTGIGMDAPEIERAFEAFAQLDDSMARKFEGSGIGLTIARGLVSAMSGRLELESVPGQGTTAKVILPLSCSIPVSASHTSIDLNGLDVLVADDNATNRKILQIMLHKFGAQTTMCEDGDVAIRSWQQGKFDLLLLDINMPRLAGTDVIRHIRQLEAADHVDRIPAIAVTANAAADQVPQYLEAGFDDFIGKPFTLKTLSASLVSALGGKPLTVPDAQ